MKTHTKQEGIEAMEMLISITGLKPNDFYFLEEWEANEFDLETGTPCIVCYDDDFITAYDHWLNYQWETDQEQQDAWCDFMMETLDTYQSKEEDASS